MGPEPGSATIHVAPRDDSSSLLPIASAHTDLYRTAAIGTHAVEVRRLDELISATILKPRSMLKIDVQGFEYEVLLSADGCLSGFDFVYVEVSFVEFYLGQKLLSEVIFLMISKGFVVSGIYNLTEEKNGRQSYADLLFCRAGTS